jgi:hypothetical protein
MYYATKRADNNKRLIGLGSVVVICGGMFWLLATGKLGGKFLRSRKKSRRHLHRLTSSCLRRLRP